jgi:hypothetical protein
MARRILLERLAFAGPNGVESSLTLEQGLNLVYGASNTGKSFACKAIDFMLGARTALPDIAERQRYDRAVLRLALPVAGEMILSRSLQGGPFSVWSGLSAGAHTPGTLSARHDSKKDGNLSNVLLKEIGLAGRQIAADASGAKRALSFRDLIPLCLVDETSIQAERSPAESGDSMLKVAERSVFKLMVTGQDDSSVATIMKPRDFKTSKAAKLELVTDMLNALEDELAADFPNPDELEDQSGRLESAIAHIGAEVDAARNSIRALLDRKRRIASEITSSRSRLSEVQLNLGRFDQLDEVYASDIERLESLEEAGFLLALGSDTACPLCGAPPEAQAHDHGVDAINAARNAALAEISKIALQRTGLSATVQQLTGEHASLLLDLLRKDAELALVEEELMRLAPEADASQRRMEDLVRTRDRVRHGLDLLARRASLLERQSEFASLKRSREPKPQLRPQSSVTHEFAQTVAQVLRTWHFPGELVVVFDDNAFDLRIDGKLRRDNGKGVRAILHAAFKVGLLMHCRQKDLPHPGFIVLDSPLVTYRDPISSKAGPLSPDEAALSNTTLKEHFFEHLHTISEFGQTLVLENVDPPTDIESIANVHIFTGRHNDGRRGLL